MPERTKEAEIQRGGKRAGAGRKPSGRMQYVTRLHPAVIAALQESARAKGEAECETAERILARGLKVALD